MCDQRLRQGLEFFTLRRHTAESLLNETDYRGVIEYLRIDVAASTQGEMIIMGNAKAQIIRGTVRVGPITEQ